MCTSVTNEFFWIGLAAIIGLLLLGYYSVRRVMRERRLVKTAEDWAHLVTGQVPSLFIVALWVMVIVVTARACWI